MAALGRSGTILGLAAFGLLLGCAAGTGTQPIPPSGTGGKGGSGGTTSRPATGGTSGSGSAGTGGSAGSTPSTGGTSGSGGSSATGGSGGSTAGTGGTGGSGGSSVTGGSGGSGGADAGTGGGGGSSGTMSDGGSPTGPDVNTPVGPIDYGGVGQQPLIPVVYTDQPVPPIVTMDCPEDPTVGWTEYRDSFVVQRPRNLAAKDRFTIENGIYKTFIQANDQPHKPNNTTEPRTETRFSDIGTGEHLMSIDIMVEPGSNGTVVHQFKSAGTRGGNIGTYLEYNNGTLRDRAGTVATGVAGKWVNIKIAFNIPTGQGRIWLNNCLKVTTQKERNALWYFKFGNYHCDNAPVCRAQFKNVRTYHKGSTDKFNVKSPIP
jgi:hypothetical protein